MDIRIRKVEIEDLEAVTDVELICFPEREAATKTSFKNRIETFPDSFFVAVLDGKIIGFINGAVTNDTVLADELYSDSSLHIPDGDYQTIFGLDVIPEYQHKGIASQLMNYMIDEARKAGRKGSILTCKDKLITFYEKFGYINKGISDSVHGGAHWYDMILEF